MTTAVRVKTPILFHDFPFVVFPCRIRAALAAPILGSGELIPPNVPPDRRGVMGLQTQTARELRTCKVQALRSCIRAPLFAIW